MLTHRGTSGLRLSYRQAYIGLVSRRPHDVILLMGRTSAQRLFWMSCADVCVTNVVLLKYGYAYAHFCRDLVPVWITLVITPF